MNLFSLSLDVPEDIKSIFGIKIEVHTDKDWIPVLGSFKKI